MSANSVYKFRSVSGFVCLSIEQFIHLKIDSRKVVLSSNEVKWTKGSERLAILGYYFQSGVEIVNGINVENNLKFKRIYGQLQRIESFTRKMIRKHTTSTESYLYGYTLLR